MAPGEDARAGRRRIVLRGAGASILAFLLLAPVMTVGWCGDAHTGGESVCDSESRSLLGATAYGWLWLAVQVAILVITVAAASRIRRPPVP